MMDIFFQDPTAIPLPPDEVRIKQFQAEIRPDNRRVRIYLEITPFQKQPNGEITIYNPQGEEIASASIIETITPKMELTMHLRGEVTRGEYSISAIIFYLENTEQVEGAGNDIGQRKRMVVDHASQHFQISS